jgi:hypothetical protein
LFQSVLPLHECAEPTTAKSTTVESAAEPLHSVAESATTEPLQSIADSAAVIAALTETS